MFEKKETGFRKWCALSSLRWSDVMFETTLYFFSTDVCEISGQRTGSQRRRRRREVGRLFDWTITPRQKSSPSVNPFHSCLLFSFSLFLIRLFRRTERFVQTIWQSFLIFFLILEFRRKMKDRKIYIPGRKLFSSLLFFSFYFDFEFHRKVRRKLKIRQSADYFWALKHTLFRCAWFAGLK